MNVKSQRGGILSSVFIIPAGVVVIITVFLLGYYMGKRQANQTASDEKPPALPEVVSQYLPEKEEFTFYKTLTEKGDKTLSIDLKPKPRPDQTAPQVTTAKKEEPGKSDALRQDKATQRIQQKPQRAKAVPAPDASPAARTSSSKLRYTIQVGSYPERDIADENARAMKKKGYAAFLVATEIPNKGTWYRVRIGSFSSRQSAEKLAAELKAKEGVAGFITVE